MAEEVEIDPMLGTATFGTAQQIAVEAASGGEVVDWKVKAVAIQLRPTANCPTPNAQPVSSERHRLFERQMNSHSRAKATGSKGHKPAGSKAKAEATPASNA